MVDVTKSGFMRVGFSDSFLCSFGRFVAAWATVEQQFDTWLFLSLVVMKDKTSGTLRDEKVVKLMTQGIDTKIDQLRKNLKRLHLPKGIATEVNELCCQIKQLNKERNDLIHGYWSPALDEYIKARISRTYWTKVFTDDFQEELAVSEESLNDQFERAHRLYWDIPKLAAKLRTYKRTTK